jgi:hypothetical protein
VRAFLEHTAGSSQTSGLGLEIIPKR